MVRKIFIRDKFLLTIFPVTFFGLKQVVIMNFNIISGLDGIRDGVSKLVVGLVDLWTNELVLGLGVKLISNLSGADAEFFSEQDVGDLGKFYEGFLQTNEISDGHGVVVDWSLCDSSTAVVVVVVSVVVVPVVVSVVVGVIIVVPHFSE